jgi:hypothetical protein
LNLHAPTREIAPAPPKKRNHHERRLTILIADYLRAMAKPGVWWSHWPAGERRGPKTAGLLKRMGVNPGASDFIVVVPGGYFLAVEVKIKGTYQSPEQKAFQRAWEAASDGGSVAGLYEVVRSLDEAVAFLSHWGATRPDRSFIPAKGREV